MRALALVALLLLPGCITGRLSVGPTVDMAGNVGVQGGLTFGVAKTTDSRHGVVFVERLAGGGVPSIPAGTLATQFGVDWLTEPEGDRGWGYRLGARLGPEYTFREVAPNDAGFALGMAVAVFPYSRRGSSDGDVFRWRTTTWTNLGVELQMSFDPTKSNSRQGILAASFTWEVATLAN